MNTSINNGVRKLEDFFIFYPGTIKLQPFCKSWANAKKLQILELPSSAETALGNHQREKDLKVERSLSKKHACFSFNKQP